MEVNDFDTNVSHTRLCLSSHLSQMFTLCLSNFTKDDYVCSLLFMHFSPDQNTARSFLYLLTFLSFMSRFFCHCLCLPLLPHTDALLFLAYLCVFVCVHLCVCRRGG